MAAQRRILLPFLSLIALAWVGSQIAFMVTGTPSTGLRGAAIGQTAQLHSGQKHTAVFARGGESAAAEVDDTVELGGFSGFVVGLALLPHIIYSLTIAFGVATGSQTFNLGPFGLELISCAVSVGLVMWSLGSFVQRGKGLPAGPLGFLGLAEGLAYLSCLGLAVATISTGFRAGSGPSLPALPSVSAPSLPSPSFKAPAVPTFKAPEFKAPDIKVPEFKAPNVKVPEFKAPDVKVPEFKAPDVKVPEIKAPAFKVPEISLPKTLSEKKEEAKEEPKAEEPKAEEKKEEPVKKKKAFSKKSPAELAKAASSDYDKLFDP